MSQPPAVPRPCWPCSERRPKPPVTAAFGRRAGWQDTCQRPQPAVAHPPPQQLPRAGCSCARCHLPKALIPAVPRRRAPTARHPPPEEKLLPSHVLGLLQGHVPSTPQLLPSTSRSGLDTTYNAPLKKNKQQIKEKALQTKRRNRKKGKKSSLCRGPEQGPTFPTCWGKTHPWAREAHAFSLPPCTAPQQARRAQSKQGE